MPQVLGIVGSPRYGGNTSLLIDKALEAAAQLMQEEGRQISIGKELH